MAAVSAPSRIFKPGFRNCAVYVLFDIYKTEEGDGDLWRIYNREYDGNPEALPEETTIQRGYKKLLLSGGHAGYGEGIFFQKKKEML